MSDIQRGNEGIYLGTWTGWDGPNERPPLPQYPQPWDLPERPPTASNDRDRMLVPRQRTRQCRSRRAAVSMRDRLAAVACYVLVFLVLPAILFIAAAVRGWRP
ncbi:MAG TPA: hypothetical protein VIK69_10395 [Methylophilaceae bacterium]